MPPAVAVHDADGTHALPPAQPPSGEMPSSASSGRFSGHSKAEHEAYPKAKSTASLRKHLRTSRARRSSFEAYSPLCKEYPAEASDGSRKSGDIPDTREDGHSGESSSGGMTTRISKRPLGLFRLGWRVGSSFLVQPQARHSRPLTLKTLLTHVILPNPSVPTPSNFQALRILLGVQLHRGGLPHVAMSHAGRANVVCA